MTNLLFWVTVIGFPVLVVAMAIDLIVRRDDKPKADSTRYRDDHASQGVTARV